jgi:hypothetical protein
MTTELKMILYLHILTAMAMVGGSFAVLMLYLRARGASDDGRARAAVGDALSVNRWLVNAGGGLAGLIGILLLIRFDAKGLLDAGEATWAHTSILLWLIAGGVAGFLGARLGRAMADGSTLRAALSGGLISALVWLNALVGLVILYLMVFKPF